MKEQTLNLDDLILKKVKAETLTKQDYDRIVRYMVGNGVDKNTKKIFIALDQFGMTKDEVLNFSLAIKESGLSYKSNDCILEKHSTGGIGDSTSLILIPLLSCLGYKIIKTSGRSLVYANGSADRFKAIPGFEPLEFDEIDEAMTRFNACVLSHGAEYCPADKILYKVIETCHLESNINFLASSIVAKKLTSGASVVLVDIKYGEASMIEDYSTACRLESILRYVFKKCGVKCIIAITNTHQLIGQSVGNAVEVEDALDVLQGKHNMLRDVSTKYAVEMMLKVDNRLSRKDAEDMVNTALDTGLAYNQFLNIVKMQHGDVEVVKNREFFTPKLQITFKADRPGYVGNINALLMGELIRRLCSNNHNDDIGLVLNVKIGDYINKGDTILTLYYENEDQVKQYLNAVRGCVRLTNVKVKKVNPIKRLG